MSDSTDSTAWIEYAEEDFQAMLLLVRRKRPMLHTATYLAQQVAEKYLKGLLAHHQFAIPRTHDLVALSDACLRIGVIVPVDDKLLATLTKFVTQARYPGEDATAEEIAEAIETSKAVRKFVRALLR